ncbi:MAG: hypothetical protein ACYTEQ_16935 [Planctomycetota bacterium]|jgi:hypothetical protein
MATRTIAADHTDVGTTQLFPLGTEYRRACDTGDDGEETWVYVFNDEAATSFVQGTLVARDAGTTSFDGIVCPTSAPTIRLLGVAQHTIAAGEFGWILAKGIGEVLADTGGITAGAGLIPGNAVAGRADNATVAQHAFAVATETVLATELATCHVDVQGNAGAFAFARTHGVEVTFTGADQLAVLGQEYIEEAATGNSDRAEEGDRVWVYIQNNTGSALAAGDVVGRPTTFTRYIVNDVTAGSNAMSVIGVAQHAIAQAEFGWVLKRGRGVILGEATGWVANSALRVSAGTAGSAEIVVAITDHAFAWGIAANAGSVTSTAYINCQG